MIMLNRSQVRSLGATPGYLVLDNSKKCPIAGQLPGPLPTGSLETPPRPFGVFIVVSMDLAASQAPSAPRARWTSSPLFRERTRPTRPGTRSSTRLRQVAAIRGTRERTPAAGKPLPLVVLHGGPGVPTTTSCRWPTSRRDGRGSCSTTSSGNGRSTHLPERGADFWTVDLFVRGCQPGPGARAGRAATTSSASPGAASWRRSTHSPGRAGCGPSSSPTRPPHAGLPRRVQ